MQLPFKRFLIQLSAFLILTLAFGCKATKKGSTVALKNKSSRYVLKRLGQTNVELEWLSAKGSIAYKDDYQSIKAKFNVRMRKDSVIWMNVKKFSIEAARILITQDSIFAINRLEKSFIAKDFDFIRRRYNLPANYQALQDLLLGNPMLLTETNYEAEVAKDKYKLSASAQGIERAYWIDGVFFHIRKMVFAEPAYQRRVNIEFSDHQPIEGKRNFSYLRTLNLQSPDTGEVFVELDFSTIETNQLKSIRFEIPSHYTRMDQ